MGIDAGRFRDAPEPHPLVPNGAWSGVLTERPRLLGPREFLRELARRKPELYAEIRGQDSLLAAGIVHAVEGLDETRVRPFVDKALANVARGATNVHQDTWIWLVETTETFDLFHEAFPRGRDAELFDWLNAHMTTFTDDENAFHNSTLSKILTYLRIAYATWGENPRAHDFRDYAIVKLYEGRVLPVLREFGSGGGFTECGWYCRHSVMHLVEALELARRVEGYDGFQKAPEFFYQRLAYEMLQPYPGYWRENVMRRSDWFKPREGAQIERYAMEGDGVATFSGAMDYPLVMRTMLAQYFRGSELARFTAARRREAAFGPVRLMMFLYEEEPSEKGSDPFCAQAPFGPTGKRGLTPFPTKAFPLSHVASGIGKVFARSDWTDDASWLRFECGPFWNQHQHFEAGNFEIFRYEPLATETGEYTDWDSPHAINWLVRTVAHNCILIHDPSEVFRNIRNRRNIPCANDGGQANDTFVVHTLEDWKAQRGKFERGRITAFEEHGDWLYVAGDCTKAYAATKAKRVLREIVFLRPHTFIILDRVTSARAEFEKTWLLHCRNEPRIDGRTAEIATGRGKLFVRTLLPGDATLRKVEGYAYGGQSYEPEDHSLSMTAVRWRIEVAPGAARADDVFLHVLSTDAALRSSEGTSLRSTSGPKSAEVDRDGDAVRVRVEGRQIVFPASGASPAVG